MSLSFKCLGLFACFVPTAVHGQAPVPLAPANGRIVDSVRSVSGLSELADGRVIFSSGHSLLVGDFKSGQVTVIDGGPFGRVFQLGGDTTLIASGRGGWAFLHGTTVLGGLPADNPVVSQLPSLLGVDTVGFALTIDDVSTSDSGDVRFVSRRDGASAKVATLLSVKVLGGTPAPVYQARERAALAPDGWLAVLRVRPYRVDWRSPDGKWIPGDSIPVPVLAMDEPQKEAYMARMTPPGRTPPPTSRIASWPERVEPVSQLTQLLPTPNRLALVLREPTAEHPTPLYDVIDRAGRRVRSVELGQGDRIVAFGRHSVYVMEVVDAHPALVRHPW
jgi:hypothetical protein